MGLYSSDRRNSENMFIVANGELTDSFDYGNQSYGGV